MTNPVFQYSIFPETDFLDVKFPQPQYLGAKFTHRNWIAKHIPSDAHVILDAFSGSQSIAFMCKQLKKEVITNDFLKFNYIIGKSLIENKSEVITPDDLEILFNLNSDCNNFNLMENLFSDIFFTREEASLLDAFRSNVGLLSNEYKQALAMAVMNRTLTRKVTMGHFAHTQALKYAADPLRVKRNRSLIRSIRDLFMELLDEYNQAVFDNEETCTAYNKNILELLPTLSNVDLAYFDPPYCNSHADYQSFYHLLETYTVYWKNKDFINGTKRYSPKRPSGFDTKKEVVGSLDSLFRMSENIPYWLISYNDRSFPDIDNLVALIKPYRNVTVEYKPYTSSRGGKGSVAGSSEVLLICKPKH